ncbi:hypothetical protein KZ849_34035, partial [Pseudomonas aeruginosa]|nr:hypothetical protein [Pseudomonas aeruginosa]
MNQAIREPIEHTTGETMPAATRRRRTWLLGGLAGAIALAALLAWWWSSGRFLEGTDDAYVRADWVAVSAQVSGCLLYTSPSPRDAHESRMPS